MMDFITVPLVVGIIVLGIYKLFELFACRRERIMLIEKGSFTPAVDSGCKRYGLPRSFSALKCGCLMLGLGLGLILGYVICVSTIPDFLVGEHGYSYFRKLPSLVFGACIVLMGGLGLMGAFIIELRIGKRQPM